MAVCTNVAEPRAEILARALRLEYLTVGWNIVEGVVAIGAALAAGSIALLGFGVDSFVESASGAVLIWRLFAEHRATGTEAVERLDRAAHRLVAVSLFLLAAYVAIDATLALGRGERPHPTYVGMAIAAISLVVMQWLARAKRRTARALASRALRPTPSRPRPAGGSPSSRSGVSGSTRRSDGGGRTRSRRWS